MLKQKTGLLIALMNIQMLQFTWIFLANMHYFHFQVAAEYAWPVIFDVYFFNVLRYVANILCIFYVFQLEIIEEGLELKSEIQKIQTQFLSLAKDVDTFHKKQPARMPLSQLTPQMRSSSKDSNQRSIPDREANDGMVTSSQTEKPTSAARARVRAIYEAKRQRLRAKRAGANIDDLSRRERRKGSKVHVPDEEDKENMCVIPPMPKELRSVADRLLTSTPTTKSGYTSVSMSNSSQKLLTPIREEIHEAALKLFGDEDSKLSQASKRRSRSRSSVKDFQTLCDAGDYVTLKSPKKDYVNLLGHSPVSMNSHTPPKRPLHSSTSPTTQSILSTSPIQCASSDTISELYTSKVLKDLSTISYMSHTIREQVSSAHLNLSGAFHSTFNYPLHSTMNCPLSTSFDIPADSPSSSAEQDHDTEISIDVDASVDNEPSIDVDEGIGEKTDFSSRTMLSQTGSDSPKDSPPQIQKPAATLCKEHGLHPTYGEPCIFRSKDSLISRDLRASPPPTETDYDSSYLSECVEPDQFSQGASEGEVYTPTYDSRYACMKMLRRQIGQQDLNQVKEPVGLSETDLMFDITQKHLSLEATRASLPDLSGLSSLPSDQDDGLSESTLHASHCFPDVAGDRLSPNGTLIGVEARRGSVTTLTTDDSPESHTGATAPVNTPNITDSGGSSSRPTTDNYDYVEVPPVSQRLQLKMAKTPALPYSSSSSSQQQSHSIRKGPPAAASVHSMDRVVQAGRKSHSRFHNSRSVESIPTMCSYSRSQSSTSRNHRRPRHNQREPRRPEQEPDWNHLSVRPTPIGIEDTSSQRGVANQSGHSQQERDSGFSLSYSSSKPRHHQSQHFVIEDSEGNQRTLIQHSAVARNLPHDRKKAIAKKMKKFSSSFHRADSIGNLQLQTLGHF